MKKLTKNDYYVLKYISNFKSINKNEIVAHFQNKINPVDPYIHNLLSNQLKYIIEEFTETDDDYLNPPQSKNSYHISEEGLIALQEYSENIKQNRLNHCISWITLALTLITAIASIIAAIK